MSSRRPSFITSSTRRRTVDLGSSGISGASFRTAGSAGGVSGWHDRAVPPRIGITLAAVQARWGIWSAEDEAQLVDRRYPALLQAAGALVIPILPDPRIGTEPKLVLDGLDGLVLPGGSDVEPRRYGADPHPGTQPPDRLRDEVESGLLDAAIERGVPVLAICRGAQLL